MKTFALLAAIALVSLTQPAAAAADCAGCAVEQPDTPALCTGVNCALPTPPALKLAYNGNNC